MLTQSNPVTHDHGARHVKRVRMRVPDFAMRMRVENMLEEALRLTTLPGEDQGRLYFFRRLQLPQLDLRVSPLQWVSRCSQHLLALSHSAQYACPGGSASAVAVYFHNQHEPRRHLLSRLLAGENPREWYWPEATGIACDLPPALRVEQILEIWQVQPAAWAAVARELVPALSVKATRSLVELIRPITAQRWLAAMKSAGSPAPQAAQLPLLRGHTSRLLSDLRLHFEDNDPRLLFFAVLALLDSCPTLPQDQALTTLAALVLQQPREAVSLARDARGRLLLRPEANGSLQTVEAKYESSHQPVQASGSAEAEIANILAGDTMRAEHRTGFAGLFFLLHPLRHLGIAKVLEDNPQLVLTHFVSRVLLRLALTAGVEEDDPILLPLLDDLSGQKQQPDDPLIVPANLAGMRRLRPSAQLTERLWAVAVRRWCRQHAHMTVRGIVTRTGRICATPVNLDITMPMTAVDLNVRRCGLDLDPGYVPWFGRVIHFHYHVEAQS